MGEQQNRGCLALFLGGGRAAPKVEAEAQTEIQAPTYRVRADFLSAAELTFFRSLVAALGGRFVVFPKVNLGDIFFSPTRDVADRNRIDRKHIDFLIGDGVTFRPVMGVELDDSSHSTSKAAERDAVKDAAFESAGLPMLRLTNRVYTAAEIVAAVDSKLGPASSEPQVPAHPTDVASVPGGTFACSSCGGEMKLRPAVAGRYAAFYGCSNYPRCRNTVKI